MTNAPMVSVVMPVYHVAAFVGEAVASVLAQRYDDFELIIVDDGGDDESVALCRAFGDPRIRVVSQANRGLAGARNTGIAEARGRYIALLDGDDRWHPDKLMLHVIHLEADRTVDVSYAGSRMIDAAGRPLRVAMRPRLADVTAAHFLTRNPVGNGSAAVLRRTALHRVAFAHPDTPERRCWFDESFRQSEDIELWLRMAAGHGCRFEGIAGLLTDYRIVRGGLSANIVRQFESWQRAVDKLAGYAPDLVARHGNRAAAYQLRYLARRAVQLGDGPFAAALVRQALMRDPAILIAEPVKTAITALAAFALRYMPAPAFRALGTLYLGAAA
ncbi:glycosyltransferase [Sphingomonas sp. SUN039]|uniref:glycosyltransferase family 2 protein n=1 Tax=Sphingomonas sp. SUN039 TaxID=2937787 RepID=UPI0021647A1C|nr:glycosyltransferase [Sphingomonas sp. SUN039]UVO52751.1 glycosyltransferase [Sphingomonas sp. SUN039]